MLSPETGDSGFDILCLLGRGIEQVAIGPNLVWRPTRYIERTTLEGRHTGIRDRSAAIDDDYSLIAGSNAIVMAGCHLLKRPDLLRENRLIIFAAGSPPYLSSRPELYLSEGQVMLERLRRASPRSSFEHIILERNQNTRDDMLETCGIAASRGLTRVKAITVAVHAARTQAFAEAACHEIQTVFVKVESAEQILRDRYANRHRCLEIMDRANSSRAYSRTAERERHGLEALRTGRYDIR